MLKGTAHNIGKNTLYAVAVNSSLLPESVIHRNYLIDLVSYALVGRAKKATHGVTCLDPDAFAPE